MPSSISHSEAHKAEVRGVRDGALPAGLRQTAANRPGQAQPVPTRDIPTRPWVKMGVSVCAAVTLLTGAWEWNARTNLGLRAGDIDDSPQAWAEARRAADYGQVAIVGDSRILFDTDQARFQQLTGVRPVQVSHVGTNSRTLLEHFANDPNFHGLLIVGMADVIYFGRPGIGLAATAVHNYDKNDKPAQLTGLWIDRWLQKYFAFMDSDYRLSMWLPRVDNGCRQSLRRRVEALRGHSWPAIFHVGSDREARVSADARALCVAWLQRASHSAVRCSEGHCAQRRGGAADPGARRRRDLRTASLGATTTRQRGP